MSKLTDLTTTNEEVEENQETQTIEEIEGVYYCERLENNKLCGIITTSTILATERGWLDNMVRVEDVEESEKDHCLYLKGYAPKKPLEAFKEEKHAELKTIMQAKRNNLTCEYNNDVFDCNEQAQSNMTSLMGFANLGMTDFPIRSTTEHTHVLTSTQLVELAQLMSKTVNELYSEYWQYKNALYECETKEEVKAIRWE